MQAMTRTAEAQASDVLTSAVAGDEAAFGRIVAAHDDEMYRICVAVGRDRTVAGDAVQTAWAIAWKKLGAVRHPEGVRPWLISVAVNETRKLLKKRSRRSEVEHLAETPDLHGNVDPATGVDMLSTSSPLSNVSGLTTGHSWRCATWPASTPPSWRPPSGPVRQLSDNASSA